MNVAPRAKSTSCKEVQPFARDGSNVPKYLQRVKDAIVAEEQLIADRLGLRPNDGTPPGCQLLPEDERLDTLSRLRQKQEELEARHRKLPLKIETLGQRQRVQELDNELKAIEDGIRTFSQPKVYIKL